MFEQIRIFFLRLGVVIVTYLKWRGKKKTDMQVLDHKLAVDGGTITLRIYQPRDEHNKQMILFFHGGGWVGFNLNTHDGLCRDLCHYSGRTVVSVDYRLAPENPFPIGVQDCLKALDWAKQHASSIKASADGLIVCGDSAGGNLAAVMAQQARRIHPEFVTGQILIYPATDYVTANWPSYTDHRGTDYGLTFETMKQLWGWYLRDSTIWHDGQTSHELATPYRVDDLSNLPPAMILLAENDPLHDEGLAYAQRLAQTGINVETQFYPGQEHGFVGIVPSQANDKAMADIAAWLSDRP